VPPSPEAQLAQLARRILAAPIALVCGQGEDQLVLRSASGLSSEEALALLPVIAANLSGTQGQLVTWTATPFQFLVAELRSPSPSYCILAAEAERIWTEEEAATLAELVAPFAELLALQAQVSEQEQETLEAREHTRYVDTLNRVGQSLAAELDLERIVQVVTDAGTELTGAQFGAFFYNVLNERGESYTLYTLSGVPREAFSQFPMPQNTAVFAPTFSGKGVVRLDDVTADSRYGHSAPYFGMPPGHLPVRSYLAVPVTSRTGEVLGGLFFGHEEVGVFDAAHERLLVSIAAQASVAIDNARLYSQTTGAEEALRASEERLRFALEAGKLGTWEWDIRSNELQWSPTLQRLHGLAPGSFSGTIDAFLHDMHPDDRDTVLNSVQRALTEGVEHRVEYRVVQPDGTQRWVMGRGQVVRDEHGAPLRMTGVCMDISERKQSERTMRFLTDASTMLASSLDYETTLASVARLAVPGVADWCAVDLLTEDRGLQRLAVAHVDPTKTQLAYELCECYAEDPHSPHGLHQVLRSGEPDLMSEIPQKLLVASARDEEHRQIIRNLGLTSYIIVPLITRGKVVGAISLFSAESKRHYGPDDLTLAEELSRRAAVAIENALLYHETRQAEAALRHRLDFLRAVTRSLGEGLYAVDQEGRATYVNPAAEELLGWTEDELLGEPMHEKIHHLKADGSPYPESECPLVRVRERGETYSTEDDFFVRRDGTLFPVSYYSSAVITDGQPTGAVLTFRDITNRRLTEAAQARSAREAALVADVGVALNQSGSLPELLTGCTDALVEHIGAAFARIWTISAAGDVLELQASSGVYTRTSVDQTRIPVGSFKIGRIAQHRKPHLSNDVAHDPEVSDPEWAKREGIVSFAGYPLVVEERTVGVMALFARQPLVEDTLASLAAIADVVAQGVERKRIEEEIHQLNASLERRVRDRTAALLEANEELEAFSYSVSHDLRAPLRHIAGFGDLLHKQSAASLDERGLRFLETIQESARHAGLLVDDLLAFSRMGRVEMRNQPVDMHQLALQAKADCEPDIVGRTLVWDIQSLPNVEGDTSMLRQVWRNLLSNAAKYTRSRPEAVIRVRGESDGERALFSVQDNGVGFDARYVDKLFGVFQRLHTTEEFEGTGIGLANVRRIIQRHGGRVWAESVVGQGATFFFELPLVAREADQ
jgi:PAS domain S-box-containing protein